MDTERAPDAGGGAFEGVFLPVTTPFDPETGELDRGSLRANLRAWGASPIGGFVVGGSTGEAPLLDEIELLRLVEWSREVTPRGRTLVAGTGAESTRQTVRLCREVARVGADAVLVRPPAYYADAMDADALTAHFHAVADASPVPVLLYHIPRYVPVAIDARLAARLARHENVTGVKDSSGDMTRLGALADAFSERGHVLVGAGTHLYGGLQVGASGGVLAVALLATEACCGLVEAWRRGDDGEAGRLQERIGSLDRAVVGRHGVPGVKAALDMSGLTGGPPRPPLRPVDEEARGSIRGALRSASLSEDG